MNWYTGFKRLWIFCSILYLGGLIAVTALDASKRENSSWAADFFGHIEYVLIPLAVFWALFYGIVWVCKGFKRGRDQEEGSL